jgi:hypothetical protein
VGIHQALNEWRQFGFVVGGQGRLGGWMLELLRLVGKLASRGGILTLDPGSYPFPLSPVFVVVERFGW